MKDESRSEIQIDDNRGCAGAGVGDVMAGSATELLLQISPLPCLLMRMGLFHNIKVMLMEMKDQFPLIRFLMIPHQKESSLGIADVNVSSEFFFPVPVMLRARGSG